VTNLLHTIALLKSYDFIENAPIERLVMDDILWYWIDFESPSKEETIFLKEHFKFHELAIEDCLGESLEHPKVDYYEGYKFFLLYALDQKTLEPIELGLFAGENYVVSFCIKKLDEMDDVRKTIRNDPTLKKAGHSYIVYKIIDKVVDYYLPVAYKIENDLDKIEITAEPLSNDKLIDRIFNIRSDLMKLRRIINPMKELLYMIINTHHLEDFKVAKIDFRDVYHNLLRLWDIIESSRDITSDIRDNYLSINSHRMNRIITILTMISTIFIPLTFIVGLYGMNFDYMPELRWKYGYFTVLAFMIFMVIIMIYYFKRKGWFDFKK
jgi:magnesium transporter